MYVHQTNHYGTFIKEKTSWQLHWPKSVQNCKRKKAAQAVTQQVVTTPSIHTGT
jgi:hypothetical protein